MKAVRGSAFLLDAISTAHGSARWRRLILDALVLFPIREETLMHNEFGADGKT